VETKEERCARFRRWQAAEEACRRGEVDALRDALGDPEGFPDCVLDVDFLGLADRPLDLAIGLGPAALVDRHRARTATRSSRSCSRAAPIRSSAG
jgi:hypothetical protein